MNQRRTIVITAVVALLVGLGVVLVIDQRSNQHVFVVRNVSGIPVDDVVVNLAGSRASTGRLAPGAIAMVKLGSRETSGLTVEIHVGTGIHATAFHDVGVYHRTSLVIGTNFEVRFDDQPAA